MALKTFFGNPETEIFSIRFDYEDQFVAAGILNIIWFKIGCSDGGIKIFSLATGILYMIMIKGKLIYNLTGSSSGGSTPTTIIRWRPEI